MWKTSQGFKPTLAKPKTYTCQLLDMRKQLSGLGYGVKNHIISIKSN